MQEAVATVGVAATTGAAQQLGGKAVDVFLKQGFSDDTDMQPQVREPTQPIRESCKRMTVGTIAPEQAWAEIVQQRTGKGDLLEHQAATEKLREVGRSAAEADEICLERVQKIAEGEETTRTLQVHRGLQKMMEDKASAEAELKYRYSCCDRWFWNPCQRNCDPMEW